MLDNTNWQRSLNRQLVAQALGSAHDYIKRYGWRQAFGKRGEPVCLVKSLTMQNLDFHLEEECRLRLSEVIGQIDRTDTRVSLIDWNDTRGRTKADVLAALKMARDRVEVPAREFAICGND